MKICIQCIDFVLSWDIRGPIAPARSSPDPTVIIRISFRRFIHDHVCPIPKFEKLIF